MVKMIPWFERHFPEDLPTAIFPNLVERLRGTPARVEDIIKGVSVEIARKRLGDTWSIQENIGHLWDLEPLWVGRLGDLVEGKPELREADLTNQKTHQANHNQSALLQLTEQFRAARFAFVDKLEAVNDSVLEVTANHPRLQQPMRLVDHLYFVAEHDDYHLAKISNLKREFAT